MNLNGGSISRNTAVGAGGIYNSNSGTLTLKGGIVDRNTATNGYGGGIYVFFGESTFDGTEITVKYNKAGLPFSLPLDAPWWKGWGVYSNGEPKTTGGFDPTKQVTDNTRIIPPP